VNGISWIWFHTRPWRAWNPCVRIPYPWTSAFRTDSEDLSHSLARCFNRLAILQKGRARTCRHVRTDGPGLPTVFKGNPLSASYRPLCRCLRGRKGIASFLHSQAFLHRSQAHWVVGRKGLPAFCLEGQTSAQGQCTAEIRTLYRLFLPGRRLYPPAWKRSRRPETSTG
jgi:hypothetical protein